MSHDPRAPLVLHCETLTADGELAFVRIRVDPGVWGGLDDEGRDILRQQVRTELATSVAQRTEKPIPADALDTLPVWVEREGEFEAECVGGPADGRRMTLHASDPPLALKAPIPGDTILDRFHVEIYEMLRNEHGFWARSATGARLYRWKP